MFRSNPKIDRAIDFFRLPALYWTLAHGPECRRSRSGLAGDLLRWFFEYRTFPDNYGPCRLWEVDRSEWKYYYGSNYQAHQRAVLTRRVQPRRYAILFQDKAVCERLCQHKNINVPLTYGILEPHHGYKERIAGWLGSGAKDGLVIKPLLGSAGQGIVVARTSGDSVVLFTGSGTTSLEDFELEEAVIVQELVKQDARMAVFSVRSLNTIRVVTMFTKDETILVLGAAMRCGVGESYVDNWSAGGVAVGVDVDSGQLQKYAHDKVGKRYVQHPTTKARFERWAVPEWARIVEMAITTQGIFPWYRILGMDIGLTDKGIPVLIEVNNSTDLLFQEQASGPLLRREQVLRAFGQDDLLVNRHQRKLYAELNAKMSGRDALRTEAVRH